MTDTEQIRATLTLCLLAAYADRQKHEREGEEIRRIAEGLAAREEINLPALHQDVLLKRTGVQDVAARLQDDDARRLAYEMAVCVCEADGSISEAERAFLTEARRALQLDAASAEATVQQAEALTQAPLAEALQETPLFGNSRAQGTPHEAGSPQTASLPEPDTLANQNVPSGRPTPDAQAIDQQILRAAITNGAIELLPESLSTLAIIPLQMRLVYQIGQQYGYPLDKGHIRDFLATLGVGVTSQYLEQAGRKLLGSLLGKKLGKGMLGGLGRQAVSSGMSFASTYALGHVAREYYAGGRTLSTQMLKDAYQRMLGDGRALQSQYLPRIEAESRQLDAAKVMALVRGQG